MKSLMGVNRARDVLSITFLYFADRNHFTYARYSSAINLSSEAHFGQQIQKVHSTLLLSLFLFLSVRLYSPLVRLWPLFQFS
jgi:hypothetical protein